MDNYIKGTLTVIAICLIILTVKNLNVLQTATAQTAAGFQMSAQGSAVFIMRADGAVKQCYASAHHNQNNKCGQWVQ